MEKFGATPQQLEELRAHLQAEREERVFHVLPENWRALRVFLCASTQWRAVGGMRIVWLGLDYTALDAIERRVPATPGAPDPGAHRLFEQLRTMERAALEVLNAAG